MRRWQAGAYLLAAGASGPFAVRRLAPRLVFAVMAACFAVALLGGTASTGVGVAFAAYTVLVRHDRRVGARGHRRRLRPHRAWPTWCCPDTTLSTFFLDAITFAMVIALAELVKTRRAYAEIYEERAAQLERERATLAQKAVDEERLRIARELHDVVAHTISLIAVQSSVGLDRLQDGAGRHRPGARHHRDEQPGSAGRDAPDARRSCDGTTTRLAQLVPASGLSDLPGLLERGVLDRRRDPAGRRRRAAARRPVGDRPVRLPHRPGGADQRRQARAGRHRRGVGDLGAGRHRHSR